MNYELASNIRLMVTPDRAAGRGPQAREPLRCNMKLKTARMLGDPSAYDLAREYEVARRAADAARAEAAGDRDFARRFRA